MTDINREQLEAAIERSFDAVADEVFDEQLIGQIERADDPAAFRVTEGRLRAASMTALAAAPANLGALALAVGGSDPATAASDPDGAGAMPNADRVVAEADDEKREKAADAVRTYLCGKLRKWFEDNLAQVKKWLDELGLRETIKKLGSIAKQLTTAAVTAIAAVVGGSTILAYALIAVAVAAVGAAIYFAVKKGLPNYCAT